MSHRDAQDAEIRRLRAVLARISCITESADHSETAQHMARQALRRRPILESREPSVDQGQPPPAEAKCGEIFTNDNSTADQSNERKG